MKFDGHALRIIRRSCGFTQSYVAMKSGYSVQYVSMLENETTPPNDVAFHRIRTTVFSDLDDAMMRIIVAVHDSITPQVGEKYPIDAGGTTCHETSGRIKEVSQKGMR